MSPLADQATVARVYTQLPWIIAMGEWPRVRDYWSNIDTALKIRLRTKIVMMLQDRAISLVAQNCLAGLETP